MVKCLFLVLLFTFSCSQSQDEKEVNSSLQTTENEVDKKEKAPLSLARDTTRLLPSDKIAGRQESISLKEEKQAQQPTIEDDTRRIISAFIDQPKASFSMDSIADRHQGMLEKYMNLECKERRSNLSEKYEFARISSYENSSEKTGKTDGQLFCWSDLIHNEGYTAKIIYSRNEGGHASDEITLVSIGKAAEAIYRLPLLAWYGRDGYESLIESEIINSITIKRKIVERLGWRTANNPDGTRQPRSETVQVFRLSEDGKIEVVSEEIRNYNFD